MIDRRSQAQPGARDPLWIGRAVSCVEYENAIPFREDEYRCISIDKDVSREDVFPKRFPVNARLQRPVVRLTPLEQIGIC